MTHPVNDERNVIESHEDYPPLEIELFSQSTMRYISEFQSSLPIGISLTEEIEITPPSFPPSLPPPSRGSNDPLQFDITAGDIELVMVQANVDYDTAARALRSAGGDIVLAIMEFIC